MINTIIIYFILFFVWFYGIINGLNYEGILENDWKQLVSANISYNYIKCKSFSKKGNLSYKDYTKEYRNSKFYLFNDIKSDPIINTVIYCYPNQTCLKIYASIKQNEQPLLLLSHNLFSTKSNIVTNCDTNYFKGQYEEMKYYQIYNPPTSNINCKIDHIQYAIFFGGWHSDAVYHGLIDSLSRIVPFYNFLIKHKEIIIHISPPRYKQDEIRFVLNVLGFTNDRIINANYIYVDHLLIPFPFFYLVPSPSFVQSFNKLLREKIKRYFKFDERNGKNIVIIERLKNRILKNFDLIVKLLKTEYRDHNILIYKDNNTNLKEVIEMFYYADVVIGEYGAGLSNILFCRSGITVFEISLNHFRDDYPRLTLELNSKHYMYYTNASSQGKKYFYVNETEFIQFVKRFY